MKNSRRLKYSILITISTAFFLTAHSFLQNNIEKLRLSKEYNEAKGEVVVIFEEKLNLQELTDFTTSFEIPLEIVNHYEDYALLHIPEEAAYQEVIGDMKNSSMIKAVQANYKVSAMSNDRFADTQWAIYNPGYYTKYTRAGKQYSYSKVDVDMDVSEAWDYIKQDSKAKKEVVIAIIDTGVDNTHPDLKEHIWINENEIPDDEIDNDDNGFVDDVYGWDFYNNDATICHYEYDKELDTNFASPDDNDDHGTHIAGIIGAVADNKIGVAGTASNIDIKLMTLKINGGPDGSGNIANAVMAIKYATMMGADIANLSWGTSQYSEALEAVMKESDMLFVAAAGNTGSDNDSSPVYPASLELDNLIAVTYINSEGNLTKLSNYGAKSVDLAAPGDNILSTVVGTYDYMSGTSMAAPQVSAVAALLYSFHDNLYPVNIKDIIIENLKPLTTLDGKMLYAGIPNAYQSVAAASRLIMDTDVPEISFKTIYNKDEIQVPLTVVDRGGSGIRVIRWIYGDKKISDFKRGIEGILVEKDMVNLSKAGLYTFYVSDYAGNDIVQTYEVKDDITPPKVTSSYTVSEKYKTRTITVKVSDKQSNVKRVKYMAGKKTTKDFLPAGAGTEITLEDGKASFKVTKDGIYSIYAIDNRGNNIVKQIEIKTIKATALKFSMEQKIMYVGSKYTLRSYAKPSNTTDIITYTSSDDKIAVVTNTGEIKALKTGRVTITAKTSSGKKAVCVVKIIKK